MSEKISFRLASGSISSESESESLAPRASQTLPSSSREGSPSSPRVSNSWPERRRVDGSGNRADEHVSPDALNLEARNGSAMTLVVDQSGTQEGRSRVLSSSRFVEQMPRRSRWPDPFKIAIAAFT